jgi:hypothetical protein
MAIFYYRQSTTPTIVTDGLLFSLDAGNPASYPGTGSIWYDLSGLNNHATLINSPTFNNSGLLSNFSSSNLSSYSEVPDVPTRINGSDFTCESVFYFTNIDTQSATISKRESSDPFRQFNCGGVTLDAQAGGNGKNLWFFIKPDSFGSDNSFVRKLNYDLTLGGGARIVHMAVVNDATSARMFLNGNLVGTSSVMSYAGQTFNIPGHATTIGRAAQIYLSRLYNKALTQEEVTQNFNATKNRFGL